MKHLTDEELRMLEKLTMNPKTLYHRPTIKKLVDEILAYKSAVEEMQKTLERIAEGGFWDGDKYVEMARDTLQSLKEDKPNV